MIYLDMDGVVADFNAFSSEILNEPYDVNITKYADDKWVILKQHPRLYRDLPLKPGANELVKWCLNVDEVMFLTAVPRNDDMPWAYYDKVHWAQLYFPGVPVMFGPRSKDKYKHYSDGDILIDDRVLNVNDWINAGGQAHEYRTWEPCKAWLETIYGVKND